MDFLNDTLPILLLVAWLAPLASFAAILFFGPKMGKAGHCAGYLATGAIITSFVLSMFALVGWLSHHPLGAGGHGHIAPVSGNWYSFGTFGSLEITLGYYIDSLTVAMFSMVTLIASCIHVYSAGYMHEELDDVTDPLV